MPTLQEARDELDGKIELLRRLQRDKAMAPAERKDSLQKEIDVTQKQISDLDSKIQELMSAKDTPSRTIY